MDFSYQTVNLFTNLIKTFDAYLKSLQKNLQKGSERSHYPALKDLLDDPQKGNKAGILDCTVKRRELLVGYIEAKDIGINLDQIEKTEQLQRYLESFSNLVLTNYLEFRWYVNGKRRLQEVLTVQRMKSKKLSKLITKVVSNGDIKSV